MKLFFFKIAILLFCCQLIYINWIQILHWCSGFLSSIQTHSYILLYNLLFSCNFQFFYIHSSSKINVRYQLHTSRFSLGRAESWMPWAFLMPNDKMAISWWIITNALACILCWLHYQTGIKLISAICGTSIQWMMLMHCLHVNIIIIVIIGHDNGDCFTLTQLFDDDVLDAGSFVLLFKIITCMISLFKIIDSKTIYHLLLFDYLSSQWFI